MSDFDMTPEQFEMDVRDWIKTSLEMVSFQVMEVSHLGPIEGFGGTYKIDVLVKIQILEGALIIILVECKHLNRPVKRDEMQVLASKIQDVGAHKGIVFSSSGYQAGALNYAKKHGIAAVKVDVQELIDRRRRKEEARMMLQAMSYQLCF